MRSPGLKGDGEARLPVRHFGCSIEDLDSFGISPALESAFKRKTSLLQLSEDGMQPNDIH